jgi:hypothetical protein
MIQNPLAEALRWLFMRLREVDRGMPWLAIYAKRLGVRPVTLQDWMQPGRTPPLAAMRDVRAVILDVPKELQTLGYSQRSDPATARTHAHRLHKAIQQIQRARGRTEQARADAARRPPVTLSQDA